MKIWKSLVWIFLLVIVTSAILCGILNNDNTRMIWSICKIVLTLGVIAEIISIIGYIVVIKKNKGKMPIWLILMFVVVIVIGILWMFGSMAQKEYETKKNDTIYRLQNN